MAPVKALPPPPPQSGVSAAARALPAADVVLGQPGRFVGHLFGLARLGQRGRQVGLAQVLRVGQVSLGLREPGAGFAAHCALASGDEVTGAGDLGGGRVQ